MVNNKSLKSPDQLFEEKRQQSLEESQQLSVEDAVKKFLTPKKFFNDLSETFVEEDEYLEVENDDDSDIDYTLEEDVVVKTISETDKIYDEIFALKNKISKIVPQKNYDFHIESLNNRLSNLKDKISEPKEFDVTDLYHNISLLKNRLEEVRLEIPTLPSSILTIEDLDEVKEMINGVQNTIPIIPEIKNYDNQLNEILLEIENVKENIPEIPEVKYYDDQLSLIENRLIEIENSIPIVPEIKYYDEDLENVWEELNVIRKLISELPEVKYYDENLEEINQQIQETKNSIPIVPEVKYYDTDIQIINEKIDLIKDSIPEVPEVKYYDDDIKVLESIIDDVKSSIPEVPEVKYYDDQIGELNEELKELYEKVSSIKVPNEDVYIEKVKDLYTSFEDKNKKLLEKINYLEEVFEKFNEQTILQEDLAEPPEVKNSDPLTPLDQKYVTLDQLQEHYRLFINRIQQQLASIGGGGETQLKYLDDVVGIATNPSAYDNRFLKYNHSIGKFEFASVGAGSQNLDDTLQLGNTSSLGMSVGVTTVTSLNIDTVAHFDTNTITINSSSPTQIYSFSASQYRSARIQIQITQGSDYQTSDVLVIHNGTNANLVEYASISTNDYLGTFDAVIGSGNVSLQVLMSSASSATIKIISQVVTL